MKKNKIVLFILIITVFLFTNIAWSSSDNMVIEEILIVGATRTQIEVIEGQLPFTKGDLWQDKYEKWTLQRLNDLNIFSYEPFQVITQPLDNGGLRVVIRVADPSLLYKDPAEFVFTTGIELLYSQFSPTLYNPLGTGHNFNLFLNWSENYNYGFGLTSPFKSGRLILNGRYFRSDRFDYQSKGYTAGLDYRYWWSDSLRTNTGINFDLVELNGQEQKLIRSGVTVYHKGFVTSSTNLQLGIPLNDDDIFGKIQTVHYKQTENIHGLLRLGYLSKNTPVNHQFIAGGFSNLPLRAETVDLVTGYLLTSFEYHFPLNSPLKPIFFVDSGLLRKQDQNTDNVLNLGAGMALETPIGLPVRLDTAINPVSGDWAWNIGFGYSFSPPN